MKYLYLLLSFFASSVLAHPHSFLDMKTKVLIEQEKLTGFAMSWMLDEITSAELLYEIKTAKNQQAAMEKVTQELSGSAVEAHYFSQFYDKQNQPIKFKAAPYQPRIEIKQERIIYHFTLALAQPQSLSGQRFQLFTFEPSYYLAMTYEQPSDVTITTQNQCQVKLEEPQVSQSLRLYASNLDKNDSPDMPEDISLSLGAQFAQKVVVLCQ